MVEKAEWDSDFFGFPVGKIIVDAKVDIEQAITSAKNYKLVYVFSNTELAIPDLDLVDKKIIYEKALSANQNVNLGNENEQVSSFDPKIHSYDQLLELAYLSGSYSRFNIDKHIPKSNFLRLYKLWLDNSIKCKIAFQTLVTTSREEISGFVTLGKKNSTCSQIGLIAVNEKYQGRSIGSKLISRCEILSSEKGFSFMEVATQSNNKAACGLYEKNNFNIKSAQYIYHLWKK